MTDFKGCDLIDKIKFSSFYKIMLMIRLARFGKKQQPVFRVVINEKSKGVGGDYLELLGTYNPRTKKLDLKTERITYWLSKGAQTSPTIHNLLVDQKIITGPKRKATANRKPKEEAKPAEAPKS